MASVSSFITVWELEVQPRLWVPYEPKMCRYIENSFRQFKGSVNLGNENQEYACYEINFGMLKQINVITKEQARVRQQQYPYTCPLGKGILWMWWSDFRWELYDVPTSMYIEDEYQNHNSTNQQVDLSVSPLGIPNIIDFNNMVQVNKVTQKSRKIKRHKTTEQYPLAVFQTQAGSGMSAHNSTSSHHSVFQKRGNASTHNGTPAYGNYGPSTHVIHSHSTSSNNGHLMYGCRGYPAYSNSGNPGHITSSNLLFHPSHNWYNGGQMNGLGMKHMPQTSGAACVYLPSTSASHNPLKHSYDRDEDILGPAQKKLKGMGSLGGPLGNFTTPVKVNGRPDDECAICLQNLTNPSDYDLTDPGNPPADVQCISPDILQLVKCRHMFHRICLQKMYNSGPKDGCLQCPTCKTIHGVKRGNQPADGTMEVKTNMLEIPGYPGCGSILIVYNFQAGIQGENHPNPGQPYSVSGFPRTCYLPNNIRGNQVLRLLRKAFKRQLVFTIGTSVTTGRADTVVWNDIHHKTEGYQNRTGFGYPDPNYLDNVLAELAAHGVTDDDDDE